MRLISQVEASSVNFREGVTSKPDAGNFEDPDTKCNILLKDTKSSDLPAWDEEKGHTSKDVISCQQRNIIIIYTCTLCDIFTPI